MSWTALILGYLGIPALLLYASTLIKHKLLYGLKQFLFLISVLLILLTPVLLYGMSLVSTVAGFSEVLNVFFVVSMILVVFFVWFIGLFLIRRGVLSEKDRDDYKD